MLRQLWFWFPGNCFLMDSTFFFSSKQMPPPIPCCHRQPPSKPDLFLMNPPHTELWPGKIKRPHHQISMVEEPVFILNLHLSAVPSDLEGLWGCGDHIWTLATVKRAWFQWLYFVYIPALLCLWSCSLLVGWRGPTAPIQHRAAFPRVCPSDGDLHFVF